MNLFKNLNNLISKVVFEKRTPTPKVEKKGTIRYSYDGIHNYDVKFGNKVYPLAKAHECLEGVLKLYSLPANTYHEPGTPSTPDKDYYTKLSDAAKVIINNSWGKYKEGDKVNGRVENGIFYIEDERPSSI